MPEPQVYIVRVWTTPGPRAGEFHAAVRAVDQEEPRLFTSGEAVGAYLAQAGQPTATPPVAEAP